MTDPIGPGSETDLALERALEAAQLRAGDALGGTSAVILEPETAQVEAGDAAGGADSD